MPADLQTPLARLPRRAWIGVDTTLDPPLAVAAWRRPGGACLAPVPLETIRRQRPDGARCAAALPMDAVFTERLEPPARNRAQAERLAAGMLDLRLPMPVEQCAVTWVPCAARGAPPALLAYAIDRTALEMRLAAADPAAIAERIVPAAHALWRWMTAGDHSDSSAGDATLQLLLHAGARHATLLAGCGGQMRSCLTLPPGDCAAVGRGIQVYAARWNLPTGSLLLCGEAADQTLLETLRATPACSGTVIRLVPDARACLATALASEALAADGDGAGDLRAALRAHPAARRREMRAQSFQAAVLLLAGLALAGAQLARLRESRRALERLDRQVVQAACRLAGGPLPARGAAAVELARRELDTRLNPEVEAFGESQLAAHLPELLNTLALRNMTLGSLAVDDRRIELNGLAGSEADLSVLREAAHRARLVPAIQSETTPSGRLRFSGTLMRQEALP